MNNYDILSNICKLIRYDILTSTTAAGSGHPTTSLSAVELMTTLFFGGYLKSNLKELKSIFNDRVIFSKGHAAPLLYSLYHAAGVLSYEELITLRKFGSVIEGHPTPRWPYVDVATGSLGQGISVGVGMAMGIKLKIKNLKLKISREPKVWVLLGDSETAEGQVWEAIQLASHYKLNNLIGILDVNRLGQRGETMLGWDIETYEKRILSFGWKTIVVDDGHDLKQVSDAFKKAIGVSWNQSESVKISKTDSKPISTDYNQFQPTMIIAKTIKGKGISFLEDKDGWHGKPVPKERLQEALNELGQVDLKIRGKISLPEIKNSKFKINNYDLKEKTFHVPRFTLHDLISTREAYGDALVSLGKTNQHIVVLDAETSNSTYAEKFKKVYPDRFFEMYIAEQNMISIALGISKVGFVPFTSSFAAFITRSFDQMRIAQYSNPNLKITGSHAGVSIGEDGPSQMALEDLAMARSLLDCVVLYPSDGVSTIKLTDQMNKQKGMIFLRTTREKTPIIYPNDEQFEIGGSKVHKVNKVFKVRKVKALIIAAGITLHEALKAQKKLSEESINIVVMDCYSVKPIDAKTINELAQKIKNIVVVEDHYPHGGLGEAVKSTLDHTSMKQLKSFIHLAVNKIPMSGKPEELLRYEEIDAEAIINTVKSVSR
jgi:transketolase